MWTVEQWLTHWLDNIAAHSVRYKTLVGYRTDVTRHPVPGIGAHRINKLEPEHIEKLYSKMRASGLAAGTVHHVHRTTLRASLSEAVRRKHVAVNAAMTAKAPRVEEEEIEPLTVEEAKRLLLAASHRRNGTRWAAALALGLRQGEALGLQRARVDLTAGTMRSARPCSAERGSTAAATRTSVASATTSDPMQDRVPEAQAHLSAAASPRLHRSRPLVSTATAGRAGPR